MAVRPHRKYAKIMRRKIWEASWVSKQIGEVCSIFKAECTESQASWTWQISWQNGRCSQELELIGPTIIRRLIFEACRRLNKPIKWRSFWQQYVIWVMLICCLNQEFWWCHLTSLSFDKMMIFLNQNMIQSNPVSQKWCLFCHCFFSPLLGITGAPQDEAAAALCGFSQWFALQLGGAVCSAK